MLTVYGIRSCDTCRKARKFLESKKLEHQFHDVRDDGIDIQMLERWADRVDWHQLLNKRSLTWRKVSEVDRNDMSREKALALILDQPTLLKRPVFEADSYFAVGFSEKRFGDFLAKQS
ncbi:MAG: Spx/MgsR family RNA polymerase-binding regulatory protein [Gammaproteobacteria bacterium]|nr:Spx/MgsR family RNA polymerase-binding regulatory protein [Gammaproteobacteria bacterium]